MTAHAIHRQGRGERPRHVSLRRRRRGRGQPQPSLLDREILAHAILDAVRKFNPRAQVRNPVMFVVLIGTIVTLIEAVAHPGLFSWSVTIWLALTVVFANFAEALAEGHGKAQANALRRMRTETDGRRPAPDGAEERVAAAELVKGGPGRRRGRRRDPLRRGGHRGRGVGR